MVARPDRLGTEREAVERLRAPDVFNLAARAVEDRAGRADGRAHRPEPDGGPVVAEVALHHEIPVRIELRHAERTGEHAVAAADAALGHRRENDALGVDLDRVRRAHAGARRVVAVHADGRGRLHGLGAIEKIEMDHRDAAVAGAFAARLLASAAPDAPVRIDVELLDHATRSTRTAATLNSGIFAMGS